MLYYRCMDTNRDNLQTALHSYARIHGTTEANLLLLHVLAKSQDPLLINALRDLRQPSNGRGVHLGEITAREICARLAEMTSPTRKET